MPSERQEIRVLLDEHHPVWLADELVAEGIDTVALNAHRPGLRGADDGRALETAAAEARVVITEDISTFSVAIALVPHHVGVVYCHHARFPRTRAGLNKLRKALGTPDIDPPAGLGEHPVVWWPPARRTERPVRAAGRDECGLLQTGGPFVRNDANTPIAHEHDLADGSALDG